MSDNSGALDEQNAKVLAEIIVDPLTSEHIRIQVLNKLLESAKDKDFFDTMFEEALTLAECPCCGHNNHWLIPEDELNQRNYITSKEDPRVKSHTTIDDCLEFQEACGKKKVTA